MWEQGKRYGRRWRPDRARVCSFLPDPSNALEAGLIGLIRGSVPPTAGWFGSVRTAFSIGRRTGLNRLVGRLPGDGVLVDPPMRGSGHLGAQIRQPVFQVVACRVPASRLAARAG